MKQTVDDDKNCEKSELFDGVNLIQECPLEKFSLCDMKETVVDDKDDEEIESCNGEKLTTQECLLENLSLLDKKQTDIVAGEHCDGNITGGEDPSNRHSAVEKDVENKESGPVFQQMLSSDLRPVVYTESETQQVVSEKFCVHRVHETDKQLSESVSNSAIEHDMSDNDVQSDNFSVSTVDHNDCDRHEENTGLDTVNSRVAEIEINTVSDTLDTSDVDLSIESTHQLLADSVMSEPDSKASDIHSTVIQGTKTDTDKPPQQLFTPCLNSIELSCINYAEKSVFDFCLKLLCLTNPELHRIILSYKDLTDNVLEYMADHAPHLRHVALVRIKK